MSKIIISLPLELLKATDEYAQEQGYNRSELIRYALRLIIFEKPKSSDESV